VAWALSSPVQKSQANNLLPVNYAATLSGSSGYKGFYFFSKLRSLKKEAHRMDVLWFLNLISV
jgi:hypothetical protein